MRRLPILLGLIVVLLIVGLSSIFIVDERKQALVLQFGQVRQVKTEPGLGFKLPFIQDVIYYEGRILPLDTQSLEVTPLDERRLVVDAFARWRITDPVEFRQAVQTESAGAARLESILNASLREVLGSVPSADVLSPERTVLMGRIRDAARSSAKGLGVEIVDVRIRRADLPEQNLKATFERMNAEREREAADERARGKERAQEIRATADRQAVELTSDAQRQAAIIRGQADAERNKIYASAYGRDPEFFSFYRSLSAYETALKGENSTLVIAPDSEFFDYLKSDRSADAEGKRPPLQLPKTAGLPAPDTTTGASAPGTSAPETSATGTTAGDTAQPAGQSVPVGDMTVTPPDATATPPDATGGTARPAASGETGTGAAPGDGASAAPSSGMSSGSASATTSDTPSDSAAGTASGNGAGMAPGTTSGTASDTTTATTAGTASDTASGQPADTAAEPAPLR